MASICPASTVPMILHFIGSSVRECFTHTSMQTKVTRHTVTKNWINLTLCQNRSRSVSCIPQQTLDQKPRVVGGLIILPSASTSSIVSHPGFGSNATGFRWPANFSSAVSQKYEALMSRANVVSRYWSQTTVQISAAKATTVETKTSTVFGVQLLFTAKPAATASAVHKASATCHSILRLDSCRSAARCAIL